jgi:uncharacterized repeat protein (TIGR03803 family)
VGQLSSAVLLLYSATAIAVHAQTLTTLVSFNGTNGNAPNWLILGSDGNFYGTTVIGGAYNGGTLFEFVPGGALTTLYSFGATSEDPVSPEAGLIQGTDGNFYGVTPGYTRPGAAVFKITPTGSGSTLHSFTVTEGTPSAGLLQANDGNFYGTTTDGLGTTAKGSGTFYGWIFKLTPSGILTPLYIFGETSNVDGGSPEGILIQARDGNLYGTTLQGGTGTCPSPLLATLIAGCARSFELL